MVKDTVRAFVAMEINDPRVVTGIKTLQDVLSQVDGKLKLVEPENVHVTLKFLGEIPLDLATRVAGIIQDLDAIPAGGFDVAISGAGMFTPKDPKVIWIGVKDPCGIIANAQTMLDDTLFKELEIPKEKRTFQGHVTVARVKLLRDKRGLLDILDPHVDTNFGTQHVDKMQLKKSVLTPRGPVYSDLAF